jgi:hypothetical protein
MAKTFNSIFKRSILGDFDKDGVLNGFDCQPKNKRRQDKKTEEIVEKAIKEAKIKRIMGEEFAERRKKLMED